MRISNANARRAVVLVAVVGLVVSAVSIGVAQEASEEPGIVETEPNDDRANATPITNIGPGRNGEFIGGRISGSVDDSDVDFFAFNATEGQAINYYAGSYAISSANVTLYGPGGQVKDRLATGGADIFTAGAVADETGTYYFRVSQTHSYEQNVSYEFTFEIADPDSFEPNNGIDEATAIEPSSRVNGAIPTGDTDVFAVEANAGETIAADLELGELPTDNPNNVAVDILDSSGERLSDTYRVGFDGEPSDNGVYSNNATALTGADSKDSARVNTTVEESGTYYVRVTGAQPGVGGGFASYGLNVTTSGGETATETPDGDALVIVGGSPESKLDYTFTYEGDIKRSGESHGAPIDDSGVTIDDSADDPDADTVVDGRVTGRLGGGGDAYLVSGEITGLELNGDAEVYLNDERVDPDSFGSVPDDETPTETPTRTATPTATATAINTQTPTATSTPTRTTAPVSATESTAAQTPSTTARTTAAATGMPTASPTEGGGQILGGTETTTESSASSGPGFGVAVALVAVLTVALFGMRHDRQ